MCRRRHALRHTNHCQRRSETGTMFEHFPICGSDGAGGRHLRSCPSGASPSARSIDASRRVRRRWIDGPRGSGEKPAYPGQGHLAWPARSGPRDGSESSAGTQRSRCAAHTRLIVRSSGMWLVISSRFWVKMRKTAIEFVECLQRFLERSTEPDADVELTRSTGARTSQGRLGPRVAVWSVQTADLAPLTRRMVLPARACSTSNQTPSSASSRPDRTASDERL